MTIHINDKPYEIPINWYEVSFELRLRLREAANDSVKALAIITGIPYEELKTAKVRNLDTVLSLLSFLFTKTPTDVLPKTILGYPVPIDLNFETIGQYEDMKLVTKDLPLEGELTNEQLMTYTQICAIYATIPYDSKKADLLAPSFLKAPCPEVLAIGNFTVMKLIALKMGIVNPFLLPSTRPNKFKLVLISWLSRLAFTGLFYLWKRKLPTGVTNS